ncbi:ras GTPase-activating-like protein IQGAP2 isoform X2 [Paramisgurnus dabryanus]|uniref:ras GTPase-activating-like protein IQGAP2 isoform X2 n=1 Tax=Paramisgurnus dabryanus TaxID=90735 RepID=UPI003CCFCD86
MYHEDSANSLSPQYGSIVDDERLSAEELDEGRRQNIAYEYLCHLEEAKQWMEACLEDQLPPTTELENSLQNGIYLGKLATFFAPQLVSEKKIYDSVQSLYKCSGLHFRHTDNTVQWLRAIESVGLPKIFYPETTDVYDRKNMPKVIYCIHALSLYLYKLGIAPQIQDLLGKVDFTEEEIRNMRKDLEKYGIQMPAFSKIGGILANELSVNKAELHAAVFAINEAVNKGHAESTLVALQNPNALLRNTQKPLAQAYQDTLSKAKRRKEDQASGQCSSIATEERDVYAELLTQKEIQNGVELVNTSAAIQQVNQAIDAEDQNSLLASLRLPALGLVGVLDINSHCYLEHFTSYRDPEVEDAGASAQLEREEIQSIITFCNEFAEAERQKQEAVVAINSAIRRGIPEETVEQLLKPEARLPIIYHTAANLYQAELFSLQIESKTDLIHVELCVAVEMLSAVSVLNEVLVTKDSVAVIKQLSDSTMGFSNLDAENMQRYADTLISLRAESISQGQEFISWNDVQKCIDTVNFQVHKDNERKQKAVVAINAAIRRGIPEETVEQLLKPEGQLPIVYHTAANLYQAQLFSLQIKSQADLTHEELRVAVEMLSAVSVLNEVLVTKDSVAVIKQLSDFTMGFSNLDAENMQRYADTLISLRAESSSQGQKFLSWNDVQKCIDTVNFQVQEEHERVIAIAEINEALNSGDPEKTLASLMLPTAKLKGVNPATAKHYHELLLDTKDLICKETEIVKIQAFLEANKAGVDYVTLTGSQHPPLSVVRKCVDLLEQSSLDLQEEQEVTQLREEVVTKIRANQQMEKDLNLMDIKTGLLVKNRITLQNVVSHSKMMKSKKNKMSKEDLFMGEKQGIKGLSKDKRKKLEAYQHLFYLLQTNPSYLAKLIFQMPQNKSTKFMDTVIFTLYNYASNQREEYLLLKLFESALREEIKSKVDHIQEIVTGNPTVIKMVLSFYRVARGQNALRQLLGPVVKEIIEDKNLGINTNPVDIYKAWVNQLETATGEASKLPYEVTPQQALSHEEVRAKLESSNQILLKVTDKVLVPIMSSLDTIPYGMRYIAKVLKDTLHEKFPDAAEDELLKIVGTLLYYRYMNPAIVAPDGFDIIDMTAGGQVHSEQRRNLASVAKMLQHAAANKLFEDESDHLTPMNSYISQTYQRFRGFFQAACDVPAPEEKFNVDEYSDMVTLSKPVIYISIEEIINTHSLVLEHKEAIASDHSDLLHELLKDLGEVPDVESLLGEAAMDPNDPNKDNSESQLAKTEISLTLTNKFELLDGDDKDNKGLMMKTKKLIVDVVRVQPGETLTDILETPASSTQEAEHSKLVERQVVQVAQTPEGLKSSQAMLEDRQLPLEQKKRKILRNLRTLEQAGLVSSEHKYQDVINDISKDIRYQRRYRQRRKAELVKLKRTLTALNSKAAFYQEQINYYDTYIKTCLDNLNRKNSLRSIKLDKKEEEKGSKKSKVKSLKYTAAKLHEKGIILEIEGLQTNQLKNVMFDISPCEEVGDFEIKAKFMGVEMEKVQLHFQDLLQLQYDGVAVMKMFDKAKVNVNLLIFLLNKKFYGK